MLCPTGCKAFSQLFFANLHQEGCAAAPLAPILNPKFGEAGETGHRGWNEYAVLAPSRFERLAFEGLTGLFR